VEKYVFRKYDARYRTFFEMEKAKLADILRAAIIEHVGSTAVPGLGGKGILDIALAVPKKGLQSAERALREAGYEFRAKASTPERLFFRRDYAEGRKVRRVHLHLMRLGSRDLKEQIAFRDFLMDHPDSARRYAEVKKEAAKMSKGDGDFYNAYKKRFIEDAIELALAER
jgi:GrpB-like predicted nucleotidyltransferase (UPF0157 family)